MLLLHVNNSKEDMKSKTCAEGMNDALISMWQCNAEIKDQKCSYPTRQTLYDCFLIET